MVFSAKAATCLVLLAAAGVCHALCKVDKQLGCFIDDPNKRLFVYDAGMSQQRTYEECASTCHAKGYTLAGVEATDGCFCDYGPGSKGTKAPDEACNEPCTGNPSEMCGGQNRLTEYTFTCEPSPEDCQVKANLGCFVDDPNNRVLVYDAGTNRAQSLELCASICNSMGYTLAGTEATDGCFCDHGTAGKGVQAAETDCDEACVGNQAEMCGGQSRISEFTFTCGGPSPPPPPSPHGTFSCDSTTHQCVRVAGGSFSNLTSCAAACTAGKSYRCIDNTCVYDPQQPVKLPYMLCMGTCGEVTFSCVNNTCVEEMGGVPKAECDAACGDPIKVNRATKHVKVL